MFSSNNHSSGNNLISDGGTFNYTSNNDIVPSGTKQVVVHQSITSIRPDAFKGNTSLESISIPNSVRFIEDSAFKDCSSLVLIALSDGLISIGQFAFQGCSSLESISIPDGVTTIGACAFHNCSSLVSITMPDSVTSIENYIFFGCTSLVSIALPDGVTSIGQWAFVECSSLVSITIPDGVISIGQRAFYRCSSLVSIAMPQSVTYIGQNAFHSCTLLDDTFMWLCQRFANMPVHQACYNATTQTITSNHISNITQANNTALHFTDAMGMTALHVLCCNPNATVNAIRALKDAYPGAASIRNVAGMTPLMLFLKCRVRAYDSLFVNGEMLPLVGLLELGVDYDVLEMIMGAFYDGGRLVLSLDERDEESRLFPFMQAALLPDCALDVVYMLAMMRPDLAMEE